MAAASHAGGEEDKVQLFARVCTSLYVILNCNVSVKEEGCKHCRDWYMHTVKRNSYAFVTSSCALALLRVSVGVLNQHAPHSDLSLFARAD